MTLPWELLMPVEVLGPAIKYVECMPLFAKLRIQGVLLSVGETAVFVMCTLQWQVKLNWECSTVKHHMILSTSCSNMKVFSLMQITSENVFKLESKSPLAPLCPYLRQTVKTATKQIIILAIIIHWRTDLYMCDTVHIRSYNVKSHWKVQDRNSTPE